MKKLYKILNKDLTSPLRSFKYEVGKTYRCEDFDISNRECSIGFYAVDIDGLPYAFNTNRKIFDVEVWGSEREFDCFKRRYEFIKIIGESDFPLILEKAKHLEEKLQYRLSEVLNPVNPLVIERGEVTDKEIQLMKQWVSVIESVRNSVIDSVMNCSVVMKSVRDSVMFYLVMDSVMESVMNYSVVDSVMNLVWGYASSIFLKIKKWNHIDHDEGTNPFQSGADLWRAGLVPSFDGKTWRLHAGRKAEIVFEISKEDLIKKC